VFKGASTSGGTLSGEQQQLNLPSRPGHLLMLTASLAVAYALINLGAIARLHQRRDDSLVEQNVTAASRSSF
jgi:hypothetical protein